MANLSKQNIAASANLKKLGVSILGVKQVLAGEMVTNQQDRILLAQIIGTDHAAADAPVKRYYLENSWPSK